MPSLLTLFVFILNAWAGIDVLHSSKTNGAKALWIALILGLPVIGCLVWLLRRQRQIEARRTAAAYAPGYVFEKERVLHLYRGAPGA